MIFLRVLSFMAGCFVLFAAPFLLLSESPISAAGHPIAVLLGGVGVLLFALGYYFLALAGHRTGRSARLRKAAGLSIAFQLMIGLAVLFTSHSPRVVGASAPLLCLCVLLFMAFVWPGTTGRSHRPMRRRDQDSIY
jgi:hypothetical protein